VLRSIPGATLHADQQVLTAANMSTSAYNASL